MSPDDALNYALDEATGYAENCRHNEFAALPEDTALVTVDALAAALHQKGYCWDGDEGCSGPRAHRYEAQLLIQAAKEAERE